MNCNDKYNRFCDSVIKNPKIFDELDIEEKQKYLFDITLSYIISPDSFDYLSFFDIITESYSSVHVDELELSAHPTKRHVMIRYSHITKDIINYSYFINKYETLCYVFVDPMELSYNNFENILNLDHILSGYKFYTDTKFIDTGNNNKIIKLGLHDSYLKLLELDKLDFYLKPFDETARGGNRFIFKSQHLGDQISKIIKKIPNINKNFVKVNDVFRYNKFLPGDGKFKTHYDTPYIDKYNNHYSIYTLLIYLTSEKDTVMLNIDSEKIIINDDCVTCLIFRQDQEHEGYPFKYKDKIFIRTELIYNIPKIDHNK